MLLFLSLRFGEHWRATDAWRSGGQIRHFWSGFLRLSSVCLDGNLCCLRAVESESQGKSAWFKLTFLTYPVFKRSQNEYGAWYVVVIVRKIINDSWKWTTDSCIMHHASLDAEFNEKCRRCTIQWKMLKVKCWAWCCKWTIELIANVQWNEKYCKWTNRKCRWINTWINILNRGIWRQIQLNDFDETKYPKHYMWPQSLIIIAWRSNLVFRCVHASL